MMISNRGARGMEAGGIADCGRADHPLRAGRRAAISWTKQVWQISLSERCPPASARRGCSAMSSNRPPRQDEK